MLDLSTTFSAPGSITTPYLRSFMSTFCVGIRNRVANSSSIHNMYVKAMDRDEAVGIASLILAPYDMIVKDVIVPGEELYGTCEGGADTPNDVGDLFKKHWAEKYPNTKEF